MTDTAPDRLSTNPDSPHFDEALLSRGVGIRFKGSERHDVEEYCLSEGWIRVALGKKVDRRGRPLTLKLSGEVEAWIERPADGEAAPTDGERPAGGEVAPTDGERAAGDEEAAGANTPV